MKALSLLRAGEAQVIEHPEPKPSEGELLLKVELVGLCGSDLNSFRGRNPLVSYPRILGHEIAATVIEGSDSISAGTRVTVSPYTSCGQCPSCRCGRPNACRNNQTFGVQRDGALTEFLAVPASKVFPSTLPLKELCLVEPLTVGFHAVARGQVTYQDVVAVFGCGGVGLGAIAGAAQRGARVIAVDLDANKLEIAQRAGAADLIDSREHEIRERLREITNGDGPSVIIEAIGLPETYRMAVEEVANSGRVVYIGYAKENVAYETRFFVQKELEILGSRNALPEDFVAVIKMLGEGRFPVDDTVSATVSLGDVPRVLSEWSDNPAAFTKIMVQVS